MNTGKLVRLNRLFSNPSRRLCSVAVDHFIGYAEGLPDGLREIPSTLQAIVAATPDAVTMHKGIAASAWQPHAGRVPMILQSTIARPDDSACEQVATPEDAVRLGADVIKAPYCGDLEAHRQIVAECPLPVVAAGGPRAETLESALTMIAEVVQSGARGATIGRNIWGFCRITEAVHAFKAVIHDEKTAAEAMQAAGL